MKCLLEIIRSFQVEPSCGLAGMDGVIDTFDDPRSFYSPDRHKAQLIWFCQGYIEYRFPNKINPLWNIRELSFFMEICSEAPGYNAQWPSDITNFRLMKRQWEFIHAREIWGQEGEG